MLSILGLRSFCKSTQSTKLVFLYLAAHELTFALRIIMQLKQMLPQYNLDFYFYSLVDRNAEHVSDHHVSHHIMPGDGGLLLGVAI